MNEECLVIIRLKGVGDDIANVLDYLKEDLATKNHEGLVYSAKWTEIYSAEEVESEEFPIDPALLITVEDEKSFLVTATGDYKVISLEDKDLLKQLQKAIGGWIESIDVENSRAMVIDENAIARNLPQNDVATRFLQRSGVCNPPRHSW